MRYRVKDLTGRTFGRLTALRHVGYTKCRNATWLCRCICGKETTVPAGNLQNGGTVSCSCYRKTRLIKHGEATGKRSARYRLWVEAKKRATTADVEFKLDFRDIVVPEYCPLLGIKLVPNTVKGPLPSSPTLDRLDPTKGYTPDNIWVISARANRIKNDATIDELERVVKNLQTRLIGRNTHGSYER